MPESECIKDPWEAACPFVQKSSMITLLVIFQKLYISVGRWCVSFFTLKPITFRNPFLAIAGELPHIYAPHFQFMSNDLKCRDKSQVNSMTFNNLKKKAFPCKRIEPLLETSISSPRRSAAFQPLMFTPCRAALPWWQQYEVGAFTCEGVMARRCWCGTMPQSAERSVWDNSRLTTACGHSCKHSCKGQPGLTMHPINLHQIINWHVMCPFPSLQ